MTSRGTDWDGGCGELAHRRTRAKRTKAVGGRSSEPPRGAAGLLNATANSASLFRDLMGLDVWVVFAALVVFASALASRGGLQAAPRASDEERQTRQVCRLRLDACAATPARRSGERERRAAQG
jgi:hypothetical protein